MALFTIFVSGAACVVLQALSRNLFFLLVGVAGMLTAILLSAYYEKERKIWCLPSIVINTVLCFAAVMWHLSFGNFVNDYLLAAVILMLFNLLTIFEIIPFKKKEKE